jgi:hypothetical protein
VNVLANAATAVQRFDAVPKAVAHAQVASEVLAQVATVPHVEALLAEHDRNEHPAATTDNHF